MADIDEKLFAEAKEKIIGRLQGLNGIGTLSEKTIHAVLKYYYAPNENYHEIRIGNYVADICVDDEIIEIQTRHFYVLRNKLEAFLEEHEVTVVHPMIESQTLRWISPETGEISIPKKSNKHEKIYDIIPELYGIRPLLCNPRLHFIFTFITSEEYRLLDGYGKDKKIRATKCDRYPVAIKKEIRFDSREDFALLLPETLPDQFTSADYAKCAKIHKNNAATGLLILSELSIVERIGKKGNAYLYVRC